MSGYVLKDPSRPAECAVNWQEGYLEPGEFIDGDLGWSVFPVTEEGDARVAAQKYDDVQSYAVVTRGVPGKVYMLCAKARTNLGRDLERAIVLRISA